MSALRAAPTVEVGPEAWCRLLFPVPRGWLNIFAANASGTRVVEWARTPEAFGAVAGRLLDDCDVWFGCATRAERLGNRRGGEQDCFEVAGVWVDIESPWV